MAYNPRAVMSGFLKLLAVGATAAALSACSHTNEIIALKREVQIPQEATTPVVAPQPSIPDTPDFMPASEEITPLKTRIVTISARSTPLRDVLLVISKAAGLNLIIETGVNPDLPITISLKNVAADDALSAIFSSADYFYTIKDNILSVKALETRLFELGFPAIKQKYGVDVGGDMLGVAMPGSSGKVSGKLTQEIKSDDQAFDYWDAVSKSISSILGLDQASVPPKAPVSAAKPLAGAKALDDMEGTKYASTIVEVHTPPQQTYFVNRMTGTIVVTATRRNIEKVEQYLDKLRRSMNRQVLIEAKIIEVELSDALKYGIDWSFVKGDLAIFTDNFATTVPNLFTTGSPIFTINPTGDTFGALLKALAQQGEVRTLSNPRVNIMNAQASILNVGRNQTYVSTITSNITTSDVNSIITRSVATNTVLSGVMIGIIPFIHENGEISLNITPVTTDLVSMDKVFITGLAADSKDEIALPTVDLRQVTTTVKVRDREIIVIGGLISKKESLKEDKIPILGDVPGLGWLFKRVNKEQSTKELVVILQPAIISM